MSAVCKTCDKTIKGKKGVTSNFITHYKKKHPKEYDLYSKEKSSAAAGANDQNKFDKKILNFLSDAMLPISIVDRTSFKLLFDGTGLNLKCRQTYVGQLENLHKKNTERLKTLIKTVKYVCTTADIWSGNQKSFFGYTCHWLDDNWNRKSFALACRRFSGVHSAERIADMISDIHSEYGLSRSNVVATVTDNASNFAKAFRLFGVIGTFW